MLKYFFLVIFSLFSGNVFALKSEKDVDYYNELSKYISSLMHGDMSLIDILLSFLKALIGLWDYKIFEMDSQPIAISNIVIGLILFVFALKFSKKMSVKIKKRILKKMQLDQTVTNSLEKIIHYLLLVLTTLIVLEVSHVPLTVFTFVGGAIAIGIGFGSQNILNNFISGLIIMVERPIKVGDVIEINGSIGRVINIGARCIQMRTNNNIDILVPNSFVLQNVVTNWSLDDIKIRTSFVIKISSNNNPQDVMNIIMKALKENLDILKDPEPSVFLTAMEDNYLRFEVNIWISLEHTKERKQVITDLNVRIKELFDQENINMIITYGTIQ